MRTPAGKECRYYYADFARGRSVQECRLIKDNPNSLPWSPGMCARCPVPDILHANSSPYLQITLTARARVLGLGRKLIVKADCVRHREAIADPFVGCSRCNAERPGLDAFLKALENNNGE